MCGVLTVDIGLESGTAVVGRGDGGSVVAGETVGGAVGTVEHALTVTTHKRSSRRNFCMRTSKMNPLSFMQ